MNVATKLAGIELEDWQGHAEQLGRFWRDQTVVLVFIRHFG